MLVAMTMLIGIAAIVCDDSEADTVDQHTGYSIPSHGILLATSLEPLLQLYIIHAPTVAMLDVDSY